jgi:hypothetical protein
MIISEKNNKLKIKSIFKKLKLYSYVTNFYFSVLKFFLNYFIILNTTKLQINIFENIKYIYIAEKNLNY